jgi:hypothetical protein
MNNVVEIKLKKIKDDGTNATIQVTTTYDDGSTSTSEIQTHSGCWTCSSLIGPCMPCSGHS